MGKNTTWYSGILIGGLYCSCNQESAGAVVFCVEHPRRLLTWLAADTGCCQGAQVGLPTVIPSHGLSTWLEPLIAW